jgi:hypothetical protein
MCLHLPISIAKQVDESIDVTTFSHTTAITNLRSHLLNIHMEEWVKGCAEKDIPMTTAALQAIARHEGQEIEEGERPKYSKEAFVGALVEFIIGDDVVSDSKYYCILDS